MKRLQLFLFFLLFGSAVHSQVKVHYVDTMDCDGVKTDLWKHSNDAFELSFHMFDCENELAEILDYTTNHSSISQFVTKDKTRITFKQYVHIRGNQFPNELDGIVNAFTSFSQEAYLTFEDGFDIGNNIFSGEVQFYKLRFAESDSLATKSGFGYNSLGSLTLNTVLGGGELWVINNTFKNESPDDETKVLAIYDGQLGLLNFTENQLTDTTSYLHFEKTNISKGIEITKNSFGKRTTLNFVGDTILNVFFFSNNKGSHQEIVFQNCFINCPLTIIKQNKEQNISLKFINCEFNSNTAMENLEVDTVIFQKCVNIPFAFPFSSNNFQTTVLQISNTRVENILLDYSEKLKLVPSSDINLEAKISTYETMLEKFKKEGRLVSYKNLDIEYKQFKYHQQGFIGSIKSLIDRVWWNYSHSKFYILWWTFTFLIVFCLINFFKWNTMQKVYSVLNKEDEKKTTAARPLKRNFLLVFLYTSFIFFGLRIDFDKLDYKSKSALILFFVEYTVGLACMFFILNAILKI